MSCAECDDLRKRLESARKTAQFLHGSSHNQPLEKVIQLRDQCNTVIIELENRLDIHRELCAVESSKRRLFLMGSRKDL